MATIIQLVDRVGDDMMDRDEIKAILTPLGEELLAELDAILIEHEGESTLMQKNYDILNAFKHYKGNKDKLLPLIKDGNIDEAMYHISQDKCRENMEDLAEDGAGISRNFKYKGNEYTITYDKNGSGYYCQDADGGSYVIPDRMYNYLSANIYGEASLFRLKKAVDMETEIKEGFKEISHLIEDGIGNMSIEIEEGLGEVISQDDFWSTE